MADDELDPGRVLERATRGMESFQQLTREVHHDPRGVLPSEMLFLWACAGGRPRRVLESGRARGVSTHLLASLWPECPIVSFERDAEGPDSRIAAERLAACANVELRFGDSMRLLPACVEDGDLVLVDGPKGRKSLELAFRLLQTGRVPAVFVHDCYRGSPEREFLQREVPQAAFSDETAFVERFRDLDRGAWERLEGERDTWRPHHFHGRDQQSYAATLACIPGSVACDWSRLRARLWRRYFAHKLKQSIIKRLPRGARDPASSAHPPRG